MQLVSCQVFHNGFASGIYDLFVRSSFYLVFYEALRYGNITKLKKKSSVFRYRGFPTNLKSSVNVPVSHNFSAR